MNRGDHAHQPLQASRGVLSDVAPDVVSDVVSDVAAAVPSPAGDSSPRLRALAAAAIVAALALCLGLARFGLQTFPVSGDEYSYRLQAEIFAAGKLALPAPAHPRLFEVDHVLLAPNVRSKYPPGWPALLTTGTLVGLPWIVNPLLAALTLAALFGATRRLYGSAAAVLAVVLLGFSPFLLFQGASFHSHPSELFALALAFYCLVRAQTPWRPGWAVGAGLAIGLAFLIRPLDGLVFAAAMIVWLRSQPRLVLVTGAAALLVAALLPVYQALQFGSPLTSGYAAYNPVLREIYGDWATHAAGPGYLLSPAAQWGHVRWFLDLATWLVPGTLVLSLYGLARRWRQLSAAPVHRFLLLLLGLQVLVVLCMSGDQGDSYGPRYLVPALLPLAVGAAAGFARARLWLGPRGLLPGPRATAGLIAALVACGLLRGGTLLEHHRADIQRRSGLYRQVAAAKLDNAVVIVKDQFPTRLTRNGPRFDGPVLYVSNWGLSDAAVADLFPGRTTYVGRSASGGGADDQGGEEADWSLLPLDRAGAAASGRGDPVRPR